MTVLVLDTATEHGVVALFKDGLVVAKREFVAAFTNSKLLLPCVEEVFTEAGCAAADLSYIVVGVGPGSYTGIRVAASFAKGVSCAKGIGLVGVGTLRGFVPEENGSFVAAIDAKIGGVYVLSGRKEKGNVVFEGNEELVAVEEFVKRLEGRLWLVTPNKEPLVKRFKIDTKIMERAPCVKELYACGAEKFLSGEYTTDGKLELLYLRKTQAEIEKGC